MRITSTRNDVVKYLRSLARAQVRREERVYLVEGVRLIREAIATGQRAPIALYDPAHLTRSAGSRFVEDLCAWAERCYEADPHVLASAAQTESPGGVVAALQLPGQPRITPATFRRLALILDRLSDPGNAGTILRTCAAAGVDCVISISGSVDLYSPKVVRAGMGAHFRLCLAAQMEWDDVGRIVPGGSLVATDATAGVSMCSFHWPEPAVLVIGSEAHGLSPEAHRRVAGRVRIPMTNGVESLNASVAAAILVYSVLGPTISRS